MKELNELLTDYYNKFNEDKRLQSRHGQIEYINTMRYVRKYLDILDEDKNKIKIFDIGAATGAYCGPLSEEGYDTYAIELVKHNMSRLKVKYPLVKGKVGNALNLSKYESGFFDITLLFGPMYHLFSFDDKIKAMNEAARVTKPGGLIFVAYVMNEYGVITYAFKEHHINECIDNKLSEDYHINNCNEDLYDYVRIEDIDRIREEAHLSRVEIFSPDGPANYMREVLKQMTEEEFIKFVDYQYAVSGRHDLIGAGAHTVDILKKG